MSSPDGVGTAAIRRLSEELDKHPHLKVQRLEHSIAVLNAEPGVFDVELRDDGREATLYAGGWHAHYDDPKEAAETFMWLLTPETRIVLTKRGEVVIRWNIEWFEEGKWVSGSHGGILVPMPFWWPKRTDILQNHLVLPPS